MIFCSWIFLLSIGGLSFEFIHESGRAVGVPLCVLGSPVFDQNGRGFIEPLGILAQDFEIMRKNGSIARKASGPLIDPDKSVPGSGWPACIRIALESADWTPEMLDSISAWGPGHPRSGDSASGLGITDRAR